MTIETETNPANAHEALLAKDNMLWTAEGRKRILQLMALARVEAIHECSTLIAGDLQDCSAPFIAERLRDIAIGALNQVNSQ